MFAIMGARNSKARPPKRWRSGFLRLETGGVLAAAAVTTAGVTPRGAHTRAEHQPSLHLRTDHVAGKSGVSHDPRTLDGPLASRRDAGRWRGGGPVVSLRSTTGYRLGSLRERVAAQTGEFGRGRKLRGQGGIPQQAEG